MPRRTTRLNSASEGSKDGFQPPRDSDQQWQQLPSYLDTEGKDDLAMFMELGDNQDFISSITNFDSLYAQQQQFRKRRVEKACDACRMKKTKCDGGRPCSKCITENRICQYSDRRKNEKMFPQHHVEMLEKRVELLTKCLDGLFAKVYRREDTSHLAAKDGSLAINVLMEELGLQDASPRKLEDDSQLDSAIKELTRDMEFP